MKSVYNPHQRWKTKIDATSKEIFHHFPMNSIKYLHTQLQKQREQKTYPSEQGKFSGAICVGKANNWLQEVTRSTYPTPDK